MVTRQWCWIWNEMSIDQHLPLQHAIDFCANWTAVFHLVYTPGSRFLHFWLHPNKSNHRLTESQIHTADWLNPSNKLPLNLFSFRTNSRKYDHIKQTYVCSLYICKLKPSDYKAEMFMQSAFSVGNHISSCDCASQTCLRSLTCQMRSIFISESNKKKNTLNTIFAWKCMIYPEVTQSTQKNSTFFCSWYIFLYT